MRTSIYQIDAFAAEKFGGNPAAVMPLDAFPDDVTMQAIARENNLAETAFVVRNGDGWNLRWFTPGTEVPLCGHATLATAWVVSERLEPGRTEMAFHKKSGRLDVRRQGNRFVMNFPCRNAKAIEPLADLQAALGARPAEVLKDEYNFLAVFESAATVRSLEPDMKAIARLAPGVIVTAPGDGGYDCVSRYFAPAKGIPEDPVTGAAHCTLAPYWCQRLGKAEIRAYQASPRGGELVCRWKGDRVELEGSCIFYMEGTAEI
jgi:PhzF family phenazine biosynthesis protein